MRLFLRLSAFAFTLLLIGALLVIFAYMKFHAPGPLSVKKTVMIERGEGLSRIAEILLHEGAICQSLVYCEDLFAYGSILSGYRGQLKAGEYEIPAQASMAEIAGMMAAGRVVAHHITFPEGLTVKQIVALLNAESALTGKIIELPKEGTLLPETYQFIKGDSRAGVLARMVRAKTDYMKAGWDKRAPGLPLATPDAVTIMASIVERETGVAAERARVAGVYYNRLRLNMKLQSDPTTIYALTDGSGSLGRPLIYKDLATPSPYNTYFANGLPPGPIANPGRASLDAALHPESHDYLYFVADGAGGHAFGKTLAEHNKNVEKWRKIKRQPD